MDQDKKKRAAVGQSIRQKPSGKWEARWRDATGRQCARSFDTKAKASRHLREVFNALENGTYRDPRELKRPLEDWADDLRGSFAGLKPKTRVSYESSLKV